MGISDFFGTGEQKSSSTTSIPPYLEAFYRDKMMPRLEGMLDRPPPVYPGQRQAGFTPEEERAFGYAGANAENPEWRPYFGRASEMTEAGSSAYDPAMLGPEGKYDPSMLGPQGEYDPALLGGPGGKYDDLMVGATDRLSPEAVSKYMNPYQDRVVDATVSRLNRQNDRNMIRDRGRATRTGNLYSAGHGIVDAERDAATDRQVAETTGSLLDAGYGRAVSQFNTDTDRALGARTGDVSRLLSARGTDADRQNRAAEFQSGQRLTREQGNQAAKNRSVEFLMSQGLTREQANQTARNQASQFNRNSALTGARDMVNQGTARQTLRNNDMGALQNVGTARRGMNQTNLNTAYEDFLKQYEYPMTNLSQVSQLAAGQPYSRTQTTTSPGQSPFNLIAGAGLVGKSIFGFKDGGMIEGIRGPRGPSGPELAKKKRKATMTPGRQKEGALPPPPMLNARRIGPDRFAA